MSSLWVLGLGVVLQPHNDWRLWRHPRQEREGGAAGDHLRVRQALGHGLDPGEDGPGALHLEGAVGLQVRPPECTVGSSSSITSPPSPRRPLAPPRRRLRHRRAANLRGAPSTPPASARPPTAASGRKPLLPARGSLRPLPMMIDPHPSVEQKVAALHATAESAAAKSAAALSAEYMA